MSWKFGLASGRMVLAVAALLVGLQAAHAQQHKRKAIDFSDPKDGDIVTNIEASIPVHNGLKDMEDDLVKPLERPFSTPQNFYPPAPQYIPPGAMMMPSKKARQLMDQKKNWMFANPEDSMIPGVTPDEMTDPQAYTDDGQLKSSLSPMQRFFLSEKESKSKLKGKSNRQGASGDPTDPRQMDRQDDSLEPIDPNDPSAKRRDGKTGKSDDGDSLAVQIKNSLNDTQDSLRMSDVFASSNTRDDDPDQLAKQAKLQAQQLKSFQAAVMWGTPSAASLMDNPASSSPGAMFNDPAFLGMSGSSAPASQPLSAPGSSSLPSLSSSIFTPAIQASSDPAYAAPTRPPVASQQPAAAPFSPYVLPKRTFP